MVWQKHACAQGEKTKQQEILNPGGYDLPSPIPSTIHDARRGIGFCWSSFPCSLK